MRSSDYFDGPRPYLGVKLDDSRRVVTREGMTAEVYLDRSRINWELLKLLIAKRGAFCSLHCLHGAWEDLGGKENPKDGTIYDAISDLRRPLKPLAVKIENVRDMGWRLVEHTSE